MRQSAQACEHGKQHDTPAQHRHASEAVAQMPENDSSHERAEQRPCYQRSGLACCQMKLVGNLRQHEAED